MKLVLLSIVMLVGCKSIKPQNQQSSVDYEVLIQEFTGGKQAKELLVIGTNQELASIYKKINESRDPDFGMPEVDFSSQSIVCLFMGEFTTGGYAIAIDHINNTTEEVIVYYTETKPNSTDMVTLAITQPYCIAKLNVANKPIKFERIE